jgi:hypothetical protein
MTETEIETGTPIKRALVFGDNDIFVFLFMSFLQFEDHKDIVSKIKESFYSVSQISDQIQEKYTHLNDMEDLKTANVPDRIYLDFMNILNSMNSEWGFSRTETCNIPYVLQCISRVISHSTSAFGLRISQFNAKNAPVCICNIRTREFIFLIMRLIYASFKLSSDGAISLSLISTEAQSAYICISSRTSIEADCVDENDISSLIKFVPEINFEFTLCRKLGIYQHPVSFRIRDSRLYINVMLTKATSAELRSFSFKSEQKARIRKEASVFASNIKKMLSPK